MSDPIDRQDAIRIVDDIDTWQAGWRGDAIESLKALPSAQPEIVRCKDCKHYEFADNRAFGYPCKQCGWTGFEDVDDDDYCSRAERLEE